MNDTNERPMVQASAVEENPVAIVKATSSPSPTPPSQSNGKRTVWIVIGVALSVVILIVVLARVLKDDDDGYEEYIPTGVDFSTGVSLITYYGVHTTLSAHHRLVRTELTMEIVNGLDCTSIHSVTMQLPSSFDTRVVAVETTTPASNCTAVGQAQALTQARDTFLQDAADGLPGTYVEQRSLDNYAIQVTLPRLGTVITKVVIESLVAQRLGQVDFVIPLLPNEGVDELDFTVSVEDMGATGEEDTVFYLELSAEEYGTVEVDESLPEETANPDDEDGLEGNTTRLLQTKDEQVKLTSSYELSLPDVREHDLPRLLKGSFVPPALPTEGVVYTDGTCFLQALPRNFLFLLDTTDDNDESYVTTTKSALKTFVDSLTPADTFAIQTYSSRGTDTLWGFGFATLEEKLDAKNFINDLERGSTWRNTHEALIEGLLRFSKKSIQDRIDDSVNILVVFSHGYASRGKTDPGEIIQDVYKRNRDGKVKIYTVGRSRSADMSFLSALSTMNGGVSSSINEGDDNLDQIEFFLNSELGEVLLSDVQVIPTTGVPLASQSEYPVLADGYEMVVRGLVDSDIGLEGITTSAATVDGRSNWNAQVVPRDTSQQCLQSYAHDRVSKLLALREVAFIVDNDELFADLVQLDKPCSPEQRLVDCMEAEALSLALSTNMVAKGLTAMVTVDEDECTVDLEEESEICIDGNSGDFEYSPEEAESDYADYGGSYRRSAASILAVWCLFVSFAPVFFMM